MTPTDFTEKIIQFIAKKTSTPVKKITLSSELLDNLGVYGDDADDLILQFCKEFEIGLDEFNAAFPGERYFPSEGVSKGTIIGFIIWMATLAIGVHIFDSSYMPWIVSIKLGLVSALLVNIIFRKNYIPITIGDLVKLVENSSGTTTRN